MCGIAGIFNLDGEPVSSVILKKMTDAIAHRGPDGEGHWVQDSVGLGHRRLAILDLSPAGHQPMATIDGRFILSFNGEIYNFNELRIELEALGYQFHSRTDTEVLLYAYAAWGVRALDRLNGMFAFALWDRQQRELILARDRYGIKPLYYLLQGNHFVFGSEVKAILAHPLYQVQMDLEGLMEYFTFQNFFTDRTLFQGIRLLPSGTWMRLSLASPEPQPHQYWDYHFTDPQDASLDEREYVEELDRLFQQAVNRQLISDVEIGAYLSGGMDSGSITAIAARQLPYLKSFTCGFDLNSASGIEVNYDEREPAEYMSYLFKTEHYEMVLKAGDMERVLPRLAWHLEEPRVGQSYPNFYVAQLAGKFVKVVLSGSGGDELFAGYPWRYYRAVVNDNFDHYVDQYFGFWQRLLSPDELKTVFQPIWGEVGHLSTREIFKGVFRQPVQDLARPEDYINHSLYFEARTFLHGLLIVEDKLSMAHGLETRVPFLDNDLVDFAMQIPVRLKLGNLREVIRLNENDRGNKAVRYFQKTKDGKLLLRKIMGRYIPPVVTEREKQGFSAPDASWFKGESIDYVRRKLYNHYSRLYDFLDRKAVQDLIGEHLEGHQNRRLLIWSLLNVEEWCRQFLKA
ncbi:asparagine synthase (glutamine-hydrolyzing) [Leptolyngbya sp. 'hensonii']|uniref:asparagine synthase (glutamine-hydrolyzing) n=1 Tax=Leptolyngbya sp. 'hensonii' TaxID=1922337 RepID=UPI00094FDD62|nr:asparagine synthase (glutamine-hydrolyzing) [Leptolyngbya sp. 'hensonii']OLP16494.1 asparagine synthase (glutamine-hydrolyzing) [Leptolyngbya sp. 'hensonii']